jgi:hypothetical protein
MGGLSLCPGEIYSGCESRSHKPPARFDGGNTDGRVALETFGIVCAEQSVSNPARRQCNSGYSSATMRPVPKMDNRDSTKQAHAVAAPGCE